MENFLLNIAPKFNQLEENNLLNYSRKYGSPNNYPLEIQAEKR